MSITEVSTPAEVSKKYDIDTLFKDAFESNSKNNNISVTAWGKIEVGKTYLACTFPNPICYLDLDGGLDPNLHYFDPTTTQIKRFRCVSFEDDKKNLEAGDDYDGFKVDPLQTLRNFDTAITTLQSLQSGTVVVDTMSGYNDWLKALMESRIPLSVKDGVEYRNQFDWKYVNQKWLWTFEKLKNINANLLILARAKPIYQNREVTGVFEADMRPFSEYQTSISVEMERLPVTSTDGLVTYKRMSKFNKFRGNPLAKTYTIEDLTYDKLKAILVEEKVV